MKYSLSSRPTLITSESLCVLLSSFGSIEKSDIVISLKPSPPKKPKRGIALVPFKQIGDAFAAVCASEREERGMKDVEITWAEGKEPGLIDWLKKMGKLGGGAQKREAPTPIPLSTSTLPARPAFPLATPPPSSSNFSTFPASFVRIFSPTTFTPALTSSCLQPDLPDTSLPTASTDVRGLDYESLTLMRLRQAERERLEREIREQEAQEG